MLNMAEAKAVGSLLFTADLHSEGERVDLFLSRHDGFSRSSVQKDIETGHVLVNGISVTKNYRLKAGDCIEYAPPAPQPLAATAESIPLDIVYEDDDIIIINKPQGMVVHPAAGNADGTLVNALLYHCGDSLSASTVLYGPASFTVLTRIPADC